MFNIGIVTLNDSKSSLNFYESKLCQVKLFDKESILKDLHTLHGIIIQTSHKANIDNLCELILKIKNDSYIPIWIKSKNHSEKIKKMNLELGVLGNLDSQVSDEELFLIIENTLKIIHSGLNMKIAKIDSLINIKDKNPIYLNAMTKEIKINNRKEIKLTVIEYKIVSILLSNPNETCTYSEIYKKIWKKFDENELRIDRISNQVCHLRNKLKKNGENPNLIKTVRSTGYRLGLIDESK